MAALGISEEDVEKQGLDINVGYFPYPINGLASRSLPSAYFPS